MTKPKPNHRWLDEELHRRLRKSRHLGIIDAATEHHIANSADVDHAEGCPFWRGDECNGCDIEVTFDLENGGAVMRLSADGRLVNASPEESAKLLLALAALSEREA